MSDGTVQGAGHLQEGHQGRQEGARGGPDGMRWMVGPCVGGVESGLEEVFVFDSKSENRRVRVRVRMLCAGRQALSTEQAPTAPEPNRCPQTEAEQGTHGAGAGRQGLG